MKINTNWTSNTCLEILARREGDGNLTFRETTLGKLLAEAQEFADNRGDDLPGGLEGKLNYLFAGKLRQVSISEAYSNNIARIEVTKREDYTIFGEWETRDGDYEAVEDLIAMIPDAKTPYGIQLFDSRGHAVEGSANHGTFICNQK